MIPLFWISGAILSGIVVKNTDPHEFVAECKRWFWTGAIAIVELSELLYDEPINNSQEYESLLEHAQSYCQGGPHVHWPGLFEDFRRSTSVADGPFIMVFDSSSLCTWTAPPISRICPADHTAFWATYFIILFFAANHQQLRDPFSRARRIMRFFRAILLEIRKETRNALSDFYHTKLTPSDEESAQLEPRLLRNLLHAAWLQCGHLWLILMEIAMEIWQHFNLEEMAGYENATQPDLHIERLDGPVIILDVQPHPIRVNRRRHNSAPLPQRQDTQARDDQDNTQHAHLLNLGPRLQPQNFGAASILRNNTLNLNEYSQAPMNPPQAARSPEPVPSASDTPANRDPSESGYVDVDHDHIRKVLTERRSVVESLSAGGSYISSSATLSSIASFRPYTDDDLYLIVSQASERSISTDQPEHQFNSADETNVDGDGAGVGDHPARTHIHRLPLTNSWVEEARRNHENFERFPDRPVPESRQSNRCARLRTVYPRDTLLLPQQTNFISSNDSDWGLGFQSSDESSAPSSPMQPQPMSTPLEVPLLEHMRRGGVRRPAGRARTCSESEVDVPLVRPRTYADVVRGYVLPRGPLRLAPETSQ
ncbi:hypothetical protein C0991_001763 [Blastosporella zonata]|nr:hypothetical protein C0991_001763 [Blastosporella zonata]